MDVKYQIEDLRNLARALDQEQRPLSAFSVRRAADMLEAAPKAPQDMNLRELFDHVAIVNDAIRAALLTHPGMTPPKSEGV